MPITDLFDTYVNAFIEDEDVQNKKECKVDFASVKRSYLAYIEFFKRNYDNLNEQGKKELEELGWHIFGIYPMSKIFADKAQFYFSQYCKYKKLADKEMNGPKKADLLNEAQKAYGEYTYHKNWKEEFKRD